MGIGTGTALSCAVLCRRSGVLGLLYRLTSLVPSQRACLLRATRAGELGRSRGGSTASCHRGRLPKWLKPHCPLSPLPLLCQACFALQSLRGSYREPRMPSRGLRGPAEASEVIDLTLTDSDEEDNRRDRKRVRFTVPEGVESVVLDDTDDEAGPQVPPPPPLVPAPAPAGAVKTEEKEAKEEAPACPICEWTAPSWHSTPCAVAGGQRSLCFQPFALCPSVP